MPLLRRIRGKFRLHRFFPRHHDPVRFYTTPWLMNQAPFLVYRLLLCVYNIAVLVLYDGGSYWAWNPKVLTTLSYQTYILLRPVPLSLVLNDTPTGPVPLPLVLDDTPTRPVPLSLNDRPTRLVPLSLNDTPKRLVPLSLNDTPTRPVPLSLVLNDIPIRLVPLNVLLLH
ncbi:Hypp3106 [Branchiostoma lanceolatum]|uniref:Hypp3106 protein n=1 Tax=Branchiostoma lanceolatum TaxID=7740 RepID=A0A8K0EQM2_BRALA|nr:Hypp3106 [Branchiostoma lanceolatum]